MRDALANPVSRFPKAHHEPWRKQGVPVPAFTPSFRMAPGEQVFTVGSCFARHIEEHLVRLGFKVPTYDFSVPGGEWQGVRPNGILNKFTPTAIRAELEFAHQGFDVASARRCLVDTADGNVLDLQLAATVAVGPDRALERRRAVHELFGRAFDADVVLITLGQVETWWDDVAQLYVNIFPPASVHRQHNGRFFFEQLSYERCLEELDGAVTMLLDHGSTRQVMLSVSPVPLIRTFAGGDALTAYIGSKSVLRAVAETMSTRYEEVDYVPTYEAVALSDWSLAFETNDHVRDEVVGEIVSRAVAAYVGGVEAG